MTSAAKFATWCAVALVLVLVGGSMAVTTMSASAAQDQQDQTRQRQRALQQARSQCLTTGGTASGGQRQAPRGEEQQANARTIAAVAKQRKLPARAAQIAIATALQESGLRNITHGDRDSLGLFQQRPSQGWGSTRQILNPTYAAGQFYDRLVRIRDWERKPLTVVAQAVQRSGFPDAYAKWESAAKNLVEKVWSDARLPAGSNSPSSAGLCADESAAGTAQASATAKKVLAAARSQIGKPYVWGGGGYHGPTGGGFDCSGLTQYALYQGTGGQVRLPRVSQDQRKVGKPVSKNRMKPGDLIVVNSDGNWGHVILYAGGDKALEAPRTGKNVREIGLDEWRGKEWDVRRVL